MTLYKWSQVAAANAGADQTCPFPEGMNPAAVNDGVRGAMAAVAKYRDDVSGSIITAGTSTSYTVSSFQGFDSFADMNGKEISFSPHVSNGANGTGLNVDGLGIKPILSAPGVGLLGGELVQGVPYSVLYNHADGAFYLKCYISNPFGVPLFGGMDYWDTVSPGSAFIFPLGQPLSRTIYAKAFARWGTRFGAGDGSTTFNAPNKAGRVSAMIEPAPSLLTGYFGGNSTQIGAIGGLEHHQLNQGQMPSHYHVVSIYDPGHAHPMPNLKVFGADSGGAIAYSPTFGSEYGFPSTAGVATGVRANSPNGLDTTYTSGGDAPHNNVQPTITCNYIIRVL